MKLYKNAKLQEAFDRFARQQNALLPDEETVNAIPLSEGFRARMHKLLRRQKYGFYVLFGTAGRRAASIVAAVLVAATVTTASVEALREPVVQFFTEVFEKFTQVFFVDDTPDTPQVEMEKRAPTHIPEGYVLESEETFSSMYRLTYKLSSTDHLIRYNQRWKERIEFLTDTENTQYTEITVGNYLGITYENKGFVYVVFSDEQYTYTLSAPLSVEELIEMAVSIKKI